MSNLGTKLARRLLLGQCILLSLISSGFFLLRAKNEAFSALLGGSIAILPELLFAVVLFRHRGARAAKKIVSHFYLAEGLKIGLAVLLFVLVLSLYSIKPLGFFVSYISLVLSNGFLLLMFKHKG